MLEIVREIVAVTHQPLQKDFNPIVYYFYSSHSMRLHSAHRVQELKENISISAAAVISRHFLHNRLLLSIGGKNSVN